MSDCFSVFFILSITMTGFIFAQPYDFSYKYENMEECLRLLSEEKVALHKEFEKYQTDARLASPDKFKKMNDVCVLYNSHKKIWFLPEEIHFMHWFEVSLNLISNWTKFSAVKDLEEWEQLTKFFFWRADFGFDGLPCGTKCIENNDCIKAGFFKFDEILVNYDAVLAEKYILYFVVGDSQLC